LCERLYEGAVTSKIPVVTVGSTAFVPRPKAVLFDLFHTLVSVPPPALTGEASVPEILGVSAVEWQRRYYEEDVLGRCVGRVTDSVEAMRLVTHSIDPTVPEERIQAAVESRRHRFEMGLIDVETGILEDDVESWPRSPLRGRFDAVVFSYEIGVRKPASVIYLHALDALDVRPADAIFVGDGGSDEHRGARAVGMQTVLVTRLLGLWWPGVIAARRALADREFADVPAFVEALGL
jgi:putative hydrolase of the HAD superfamily